MASTGDTAYSSRRSIPEEIEREASNTLTRSLQRDGATVALTEATVTLKDPNGTEVFSASADSITNGVATYVYAAPVGLDLDDGYLLEWQLKPSGDKVVTIRDDAIVCRRRLYCPISDADLFRRYPELDPSGDDPVTSLANFQSFIDEGWDKVRAHLIAQGVRPHLIISSSALREVAMEITLELVCDAHALTEDDRWDLRRERHRKAIPGAWAAVRLRVAEDDDADAIDENQSPGAHSGGWWMF